MRDANKSEPSEKGQLIQEKKLSHEKSWGLSWTLLLSISGNKNFTIILSEGLEYSRFNALSLFHLGFFFSRDVVTFSFSVGLKKSLKLSGFSSSVTFYIEIQFSSFSFLFNEVGKADLHVTLWITRYSMYVIKKTMLHAADEIIFDLRSIIYPDIEFKIASAICCWTYLASSFQGR